MRASTIDLPSAPIEVAARLRHLPGFVFFDSSLAPSGQEISILAAQPSLILSGSSEAEWQRLGAALEERKSSHAQDLGGPLGFAAGWVEYDGSFCFGIYEEQLVYSHATGSWSEIGTLSTRMASPVREVGLSPQFTPEMTRSAYERTVARAREYIAAGDIYQVNLAHRFSAPWFGDAFPFYTTLREISPAPQSVFLDLAGRQVLSASPESFLHLSGRAARTRPIKGTRPRRQDNKEDERSGYDLITSPKEVAELVMITDLLRSDLGRIACFGSVRVAELIAMERFEQVFHLVSTVHAELRPEIDHASALRACFPGGSITGAPKKRAMEIIAELEPCPRRLYTGAIGYFGFNEESAFNLAIRTVVVESGEMHFHVGAGIVADSDPAAEYRETLDKASGILLAASRAAAASGARTLS